MKDLLEMENKKLLIDFLKSEEIQKDTIKKSKIKLKNLSFLQNILIFLSSWIVTIKNIPLIIKEYGRR